MITDEDKAKLQSDTGIPHLPTDLTYECRMAVSGEGPRSYDWSDKPHRLVFDLCREIERLAALSVSPVVVKPLEWTAARVSDKWPRFTAKTVFGTYYALRFSTGGFGGSCPNQDRDEPNEIYDGLGSIEAAKSAAFSDYSARIMSAIEPAGVGVEAEAVPYQNRVADAHYALFHDDPTDIPERNARAFEEATETAQAFGMTRDEAVALVDYTFSRPVGDPAKEIGAKILTAFSLGIVAGIDVMAAAEADLEKLQRPETIARIRAKRATRHGRGPLPGFDPAALTKEGEQ